MLVLQLLLESTNQLMHVGSLRGVRVCVGVRCFWSRAVFFACLAGRSRNYRHWLPKRSKPQRKQQVDHTRDYFAQRGRLNNVAFRIRAANHRDCKNRSAQIGLDAGTVPSLPRKFRSYSHEALSVSWTRATVLSVAETSPAAAGGIKPGDQLMTFNNEAVPGSETAEWISRFVRDNGERPIHVLVRRDGIEETRTVTPVIACAIPVGLITDSSPNAFTTGDRIVVHSSILRIARTDAQLALVLGHELAHANLGHLDKQWANQVLGWAGGAAIDAGLVLGGISTGGIFTRQFARAGALEYSVSFEREADYVGAYYAARAGHDLTGAEEIWRALSLESPDDIRVGRTHPVTPVRFVQMQKVIAEIAEKQRRNAPLVPELKAVQAEAISADE
jgi:beta-barrel assembly-enhancing protease